ncbi:MAG: hypothetical protein II293_01105, partial [Bacteroidaceae bacterium]|nr:hypothetical protein [Bacteroidaceae bacterium]
VKIISYYKLYACSGQVIYLFLISTVGIFGFFPICLTKIAEVVTVSVHCRLTDFRLAAEKAAQEEAERIAAEEAAIAKAEEERLAAEEERKRQRRNKFTGIFKQMGRWASDLVSEEDKSER